MFYLVYVSAAVTWFSPSQLRELLAQTRPRNQQAGITGMLLYKEGNFMQVLEGEEPVVRALAGRIAADRRHQGMLVIDSGHQEARQFGDWSMGFADLGDPGTDKPEGYTPFLETALTDPEFARSPHRAWELLRLFRAMS